MQSRIKAVIFDMDGVLIDAKDWHYEALNRALDLFGFSISRYDHLITYDGLPTSKKLDMLTKERGLPVKLHSFINNLKQIYTHEFIHTKCKPTFQHEFALSKLKELSYKLAVASNSIRSSVELMMEKSALAKYLDRMLSNQDVSHPKPNPEIYLKAAAALGVQPSECLVLEDNENGIKAARDAGTHVLIIDSIYSVTLENILSKISTIVNGVK